MMATRQSWASPWMAARTAARGTGGCCGGCCEGCPCPCEVCGNRGDAASAATLGMGGVQERFVVTAWPPPPIDLGFGGSRETIGEGDARLIRAAGGGVVDCFADGFSGGGVICFLAARLAGGGVACFADKLVGGGGGVTYLVTVLVTQVLEPSVSRSNIRKHTLKHINGVVLD